MPAYPVVYPAPTDAGLEDARSLQRRNDGAAVERMVNLMLRRSEPTAEKSPVYRSQVPGLSLLATIGTGPVRGAWWTGSRAFVVVSDKLYELFSDWTFSERGTLSTATGVVSFAQGLFSLVVVDGPAGYVLTLATNAFSAIGDEDFYGSDRVSFLDGKFIFVRPGTQQFYWSESVDTADSYDALDFASAESAPDNIVAHLVDHRELWLFGGYTSEVWFAAPSGDQVYARNNGASVEVGCAATHSAQQVDNSVYWLGRDKRGQGTVWTAGGSNGYTPIRISTQELEEELSKLADLSGATAFAYQDSGQTFYVLQVPGLSTTWLYDASVQRWHERAELIDGEWYPWRPVAHMFAFGRQIVGDANGAIYAIDPLVDNYGGSIMSREWISPHASSRSLKRVFFDRVELDVSSGQTLDDEPAIVEMRYSNDGGQTWGAWVSRSLGGVGEYSKRLVWDRCGHGRSRVWHFRCTSNARFSILGFSVSATEGQS